MATSKRAMAVTACAALVLGVAMSVAAQDVGGSGDSLPLLTDAAVSNELLAASFRNMMYRHVRNAAVQKELAVGDEVRDKTAKLADSWRVELRAEMERAGVPIRREALKDLSAEQLQEMRTTMADVVGRTRDRLSRQAKETLTPEKYARLQQIGWQYAGAPALRDPVLAKEVNLTTDQQTQIKAVFEEAEVKWRELMPKGAGTGVLLRADDPGLLALNKARDEKALAILTAEQRGVFERLMGKPFDVSRLRPTPKSKPGATRP